VRLAEALLSLVTDRERASCIAGDLAESDGGHASGPFWAELVSICVALLWLGLRSSARRSAWLVASGFVLWFSIYASIRVLGAAAGVHGIDAPWLDCRTLPPTSLAYLAITLCLSNLITGAIMGRRARAGGLNACAPLAVLWLGIAAASPVWMVLFARPTWYCAAVYLLGLPLLYALPLLYGASLARPRSAA
jgi:hypothetical protein